MLFQDVAPSRAQIHSEVAAALQHDTYGIFLDSSLLIHCYELSKGARDELLAALQRLVPKVHVPMWAANETWRNGRSRKPERRFDGPKQKVDSAIENFSKLALRLHGDQIGRGESAMTRDAFEHAFGERSQELKLLMSKAADTSDSPEDTQEALHPLLNEWVVNSDISSICSRARTEGPFRNEHGIPPGGGDARKEKRDPSGNLTKDAVGNQFGDLIIWFEILAFAREHELTGVVIITRDVTKGDWVYRPRLVLDDEGRPQKNSSITLPLPLLISEARSNCPALERLHIISIEEFVQVLAGQMRVPTPKLTAALQMADDKPTRRTAGKPRLEGGADSHAEAAIAHSVDVRTTDLIYEADPDTNLGQLAIRLRASDWDVQNRAAVELARVVEAPIPREVAVLLGRSLAFAGAALAVEPMDLLRRLLSSDEPDLLAHHVLVGALAEIYLDVDGNLKAPTSTGELTSLVFAAARNPDMEETAKSFVVNRLEAQRRSYLALPDEGERGIALKISTESSNLKLVSVRANGVELLEVGAPRSRVISSLTADATMTGSELLTTIANRFVVPESRLLPDFAIESQYTIPAGLGFVPWGPGTGLVLRELSHEA